MGRHLHMSSSKLFASASGVDDPDSDLGFDGSHGVLLGVGGTGRSSLVRLATHLIHAELYILRPKAVESAATAVSAATVATTTTPPRQDVWEWRDTLRLAMLTAGLQRCQVPIMQWLSVLSSLPSSQSSPTVATNSNPYYCRVCSSQLLPSLSQSF